MNDKIKAAFIGFGEINTPREIIENKLKQAKEKLNELEIELISTGYVCDDKERKEAEIAIRKLKMESFDFLIICIAGWIPSYPVIRILEEFSYKPILLWGLSGSYENGRLMTTGAQAGTSSLRKVFEDFGYKFKYIYNTPDSFCDIKEIENFAKAAKTVNMLKYSRVGMMGFRDMKLYGTLYDGISLRSKIGPEIEFFEMLEICQRIERLNDDDILKEIKRIKEKYRTDDIIKDKYFKKGVELYLTTMQKVQEEKFQAISLNDVDGVKKLLNFTPALTLMLLSDELGICTIPENDALGSVTQLINKYLTEQIGAYMEFYEFMEDRVLIGVPDYVPSEIVDGEVKLMLSKFGNLDKGLINVSKVKTGKITLSRLVSKGDSYSLHVVTGTAVEPRKWFEVGWENAPQLPSLEVILDVPIKEFAQKIMSQHYILSYGNNIKLFEEFCKLTDIRIIL